MALSWVHESAPAWNEAKRRIVGGAPAGVFPALKALGDGALLPGDWWRVEDDGEAVGYGWMDVTWGDAEILLAVDPSRRNKGVGSFIVEHLTREADHQGLRYLYNVIPAAHPEPAKLKSWLIERGFAPSGEGELLRRSVKHQP